MLVASVQEGKFCKLRVDSLYIKSLNGCSLNELQIFFLKRVKYDMIFHSVLITRMVNLESPRGCSPVRVCFWRKRKSEMSERKLVYYEQLLQLCCSFQCSRIRSVNPDAMSMRKFKILASSSLFIFRSAKMSFAKATDM